MYCCSLCAFFLCLTVSSTVATFDLNQLNADVQFVNGTRSVNNTDESVLLLSNGAPETSKAAPVANDIRKIELSPVNYEITTNMADSFFINASNNSRNNSVATEASSSQTQPVRAYNSVYVDSTNAVVARVVAPNVPSFGPEHQIGSTNRYYKPVNLLKDTEVTSIWTEWGGWTVCSSSQQFRARSCYTYRGFQCFGSKTDSRRCDDISGLPIDESPKISSPPEQPQFVPKFDQNAQPPSSNFQPSAANGNVQQSNQPQLQQSVQNRPDFQQFQPWGSNFAPSFTGNRRSRYP